MKRHPNHFLAMQAPSALCSDRSACEPSLCMTRAMDVHEHAEQLPGWYQRYEQITAGRYSGQLIEYREQGLQVFREDTSHALLQLCQTWPDAIWVGIPMPFDADRLRLNGHPVSAGEWMLRQGGEPFELQTPVNQCLYGIVMSKQLLADTANAHGLTIDWWAWRQVERLRVNELYHLACQMAVRTLLQPSVNTAAVSTYLKELMVQQLASPPDWWAPERTSWVRSRHIVRRAREMMEHAPQDRLSVPALCNHLHVSRRTLQYCFERVAGMSPMQYLKLARLNAAQRHLRHLAHEDVCVQEVAFQCGFWHMGQFSADYKKLFAETPSASLSRWRGQ